MRLDLADLRLFMAIVDAGSITQGAARAHLALPSASERLRNMEASVGTPLLLRQPRGVLPTPAGEALAHHARRLLQQHAHMQHEPQAWALGEQGTVRLFANTSAMTAWLPARLGPWLAQRPALQLDLQERSSAEIVDAVVQGLVEVGVVASSVDPRGTQLQAVADDQLVLVGAAPARAAQGAKAETQRGRNGQLDAALQALASARTLHFRDTLALPFVGLSARSALLAHIDLQAQRLGARLNYRLRVGEVGDLLTLLSQGLGVAVLPQRLVPARRGLRTWRLRDAWCQRQLCTCTLADAEPSAPMRSLLAALHAEAAAANAALA